MPARLHHVHDFRTCGTAQRRGDEETQSGEMTTFVVTTDRGGQTA
jgi:hypothetical protein